MRKHSFIGVCVFAVGWRCPQWRSQLVYLASASTPQPLARFPVCGRSTAGKPESTFSSQATPTIPRSATALGVDLENLASSVP